MAPYPAFPVPADEDQRLRDLERYGLFQADSDEHFDRILDLAAAIFRTPIVALSLVEADRQWFLAKRGLDVRETPREMAFCAHAIAHDDVMVVPDARADERFRSNPLVFADPHIRFYAGAPLQTPEGHNLGTLCVIDREPRDLSAEQRAVLHRLAQLAMRELELRRLAHLCPVTGLPTRHTFLTIGEREFARARRDHHPLSLLLFDVDNLRLINNRWGHPAGDRVLADLVQLARTFLQEQDFAARLGDGEFALLLVGIDADQAMALAEALRTAVTHLPGVHTHSDFRLHISGGLTALASQDRAFPDLILRAERALELAKGNGRDQIASLFDGP
ncbi:sensor domain-containing diguanylate cyclase [Cyanobium sp. N.Huapi 1H5]|uniref:GGDEF domain-containing protein n=1 Tax=Cyanobium sp. N.Huapi 1H5 TaxID=2823719 RepID=UPI0020CE87C9|nr:sensor domain-containing diguanylate cyclase [Cyanobium sp. N.Huapi 1H5]MCP9836946.1 sensor domain-containing diguanylate cyclase [Cyanobium sp. N.Huapi 1H5]